MASITQREYHSKYRSYNVNLDGTTIDVTVTAASSVAKKWLVKTLHLRRRYRTIGRLVVGLGVQWTPDVNDPNPPADTLQLCVGLRCLIFQLTYANHMPERLRRFLLNPLHTFVGFWNHSDRRKLEISRFNLEMSRDPVDLRRYVETEEGEGLAGASVREIVKECLGYDVEQSREISRSDWDEYFLSHDQVLYATVDAHCAFLIGRNLRAWELA